MELVAGAGVVVPKVVVNDVLLVDVEAAALPELSRSRRRWLRAVEAAASAGVEAVTDWCPHPGRPNRWD